jgi:hypothetical protein
MKIILTPDAIKKQQRPESVLVIQGEGSLGAYEYGVYKTLSRHNIWLDLITLGRIKLSGYQFLISHFC